MCGLAGFHGQGSRSDLERMITELVHRGPDGAGSYIDDDNAVYLGHRRLAIVDIDAGKQPMWNETGDVGVVFNGEIYNHAELRVELIARGHHFASSHSDTEVLVHGYEEWGADLPGRLNGMFAFATYDKTRRRMFLARDRFGEKPLYYCAGPECFAFASELTALAAHSAVSNDLNQRALQKFFAYGFVPAPHAMLAGTSKLPGGHHLTYELDTGVAKVAPYWRFELTPDGALGDADEPALVDELEALLRQAAERRLMSDVPLGVFLSGGLDSSCIVAALASVLPAEQLATYTIGFSERSYDETGPAQIVADFFGTQHSTQMLEIDTARELIPDVLGRLDEPLGDASILPTHLLSAFTRKHVTVALSGDGGDELFAGYDPFLALLPAQIYDKTMPRWGHRKFRTLADLLPKTGRNMSFDFKMRRTLMGLSYPKSSRLPIWMSPLEPSDLADLLNTPVHVEDIYDEAIALFERSDARTDVERALEYFTTFYLPDDILMKVDRAAMMCSLETRAVFLDNDLVAFCQRLPTRFKLRGRTRKYLLKKVAERQLPADIVERRKKGFGIPLSDWLKTVPPEPPLRPLAGLDGVWAARAWRDHRNGRTDRRLFLWSWLSLQHFAANVSAQKNESPVART